MGFIVVRKSSSSALSAHGLAIFVSFAVAFVAYAESAEANYQGAGPSVLQAAKSRPAATGSAPRPAVRAVATSAARPSRRAKVDDVTASSSGSLTVQTSIPVGTTDAATTSANSALPSTTMGALPPGVRGVVAPAPAAAPVAVMPPTNSQDPNLLPMMLQVAGALIKGMPTGETGKNYSADADLRSTVEKANAMNRYVADVGAGVQGVPPTTCTSCLHSTTQDPRFETCRNGNSYFEDVLAGANIPALALVRENQPSASTVTCVAESMRASSGAFNFCSRGHGGYGSRVPRPCVSEKMARTVASAFELTSECLAGYVDPQAERDPEVKASLRRAMFQLINHESGFVTNSVSPTQAGGMGQLVQSAIQHINRDEFGKIQSRIRSSSNPACRQLAKADYRPMQGNLANACERVALQNGNPQLNMMYTMAHMRLIYDQVAGQLDRAGVPANQRAPLLHQLLVWGHNVGSGGLGEILRISLARNGQLLRAGNTSEFLQRMQQDTSRWHAAKGQRDPREPTRFLARTQNDLASIEKRVNGSCGVIK